MACFLRSNPQAFISTCKEPNYFARCLSVPGCYVSTQRWHTSWDGYLDLFKEADERHLVVGEASTRYLRCEEALREIRRVVPEARIVACVRNPIDLARSWHAQKIQEGQESEPDFEKAWRLQNTRRAGKRLPAGLSAADALFYGKIASVGRQVERLLTIFPADQVNVVVYEDLSADAQAVAESLLDFLGLRASGADSVPVVNVRREFRWRGFSHLFAGTSPPTRRALGLERGGYLHRLVVKYLTRTSLSKKIPLAPNFLDELRCYFQDDVLLLGRILGRDLHSRWLKDASSSAADASNHGGLSQAPTPTTAHP